VKKIKNLLPPLKVIIILALFIVLICYSGIEIQKTKKEQELITWAYNNDDLTGIEISRKNITGRPYQYVQVQTQNTSITFSRRTINMWGYTSYGWEVWDSLDDPAAQKEALAIIKKLMNEKPSQSGQEDA